MTAPGRVLAVEPRATPSDEVPPGLRIRGGAGGTVAHLTDLLAAADALDRAAAALDEGAERVAEVARLVDAAAVWSPPTALAARGALASVLSPWWGVAACAARARSTAEALRAAAALYTRADLDVTSLLRAGAIAGGTAFGEAGPVVWAASGIAALVVARQLLGVVTLRALRELPGPIGLTLSAAGSRPMQRVPGLVGLGARALSGPGLLPPGPPQPTAAAVEPLLPGAAAFLVAAMPGRARLAGRDPVPAAAHLLGAGARAATRLLGTPTTGLLVTRSISASGACTASGAVPARAAPRDVGDVLQQVHEQYPSPDGGGGEPGSVGVQELTHPDGSRAWVVAVPGTQEWSPVAGGNPFDLTSDLQAVATFRDDASEMVVRAMDQAGIRPQEPVMLAGHSLGGLVAMDLATDPAFQDRFRVSAVVTAGSPVGAVGAAGLPAGAQGLHLETAYDLVPALDGLPNPDDARRTTVVMDPRTAGWVSDPAALRSPLGAHSSLAYVDLARELEGVEHSSLAAFSGAVDPVLGPPGTTVRTEQYVGTRVR